MWYLIPALLPLLICVFVVIPLVRRQAPTEGRSRLTLNSYPEATLEPMEVSKMPERENGAQ